MGRCVTILLRLMALLRSLILTGARTHNREVRAETTLMTTTTPVTTWAGLSKSRDQSLVKTTCRSTRARSLNHTDPTLRKENKASKCSSKNLDLTAQASLRVVAAACNTRSTRRDLIWANPSSWIWLSLWRHRQPCKEHQGLVNRLFISSLTPATASHNMLQSHAVMKTAMKTVVRWITAMVNNTRQWRMVVFLDNR